MEELNNQENQIVLACDVSTKTCGICLLFDNGDEYSKIIELTHINPKAPKKDSKKQGKGSVKGIEELFLKKKHFEEFIQQFKDFKITKAVIEEPLLSSNNQVTVATLLRFNGMISDVIYNTFGVVPDYISSHDARAYAFPELLAIRKYGKDGLPYENKKIIKAIKSSNFTLFGSYPWTIDKKHIVQGKIAEHYPEIEWKYNEKGELKVENFDAADSAVAGLGQIHKEAYGELKPQSSNVEVFDDRVEYDVNYWGKTEHRTTYLNSKEVESDIQNMLAEKKRKKEQSK